MKKQGALFGGFKVPQIKEKDRISKLVNKIKKPKSSGASTQKLTMADVENRVAAYTEKVAQRLPEYRFDLLTTEQQLSDYLDAAIINGVISYDTETTGLDVLTDKVVGICLYTRGQNPVYVPYNHIDYEYNVNVRPFIDRLVVLSREEKITVVMAKATFDQRVTKQTFDMEFYIRCLWDVQMGGRFLNENDRYNNLKFLWEKYIMNTPEEKIVPDSYKSLFGHFKFDTINPELGKTYGGLDGLMTYQLYEFQKQYLGATGQHTDRVGLRRASESFPMWNRLSEAVSEMMDNGVKLDPEAIEKIRELLQAQLSEIRLRFDSAIDEIAEEFLTPLMHNNPELFSKIARPLNPGSSTQLAILFYDAMNLHQYKKRSTDEGVVERLVKKYPQYKSMLSVLIEYRGVKKLLSTYAEGLQRRVHPLTGRLHTVLRAYGARTGRYTSKDPNLQNIPSRTEIGRSIRKAFVPTEGYYLIGSDYSQQEPRLLAFASQDKNMIQSYNEGKDLYANTASIVYKVPYDHCLESFGKEGKKRRTSMKSIILGIMYSRGANSIAEQLGIASGAAKSIIAKFYTGFPHVKKYVDEQKAFCKRNGFVYTVWGRKCRIPEINLPPYEFSSKQPLDDYTKQEITKDLSKIWGKTKTNARIAFYANEFGIKIKDNTFKIASAERQIVNSIIQGSAADMINEAVVMLYLDEEFRQLGGKLLLTVHDEIIAEAPKATAVKALARMELLMVEASKKYVTVPMRCDGEILERWAGVNIKERVINA